MASLTIGNPWRAHVARSWSMDGVEVAIARVGARSSDFITEISSGAWTVLQTVDTGMEHPKPLRLPEEAVEPLRDALNEYLGKPKDDFRAKYEEARDALAVERRRVDDLLARQS